MPLPNTNVSFQAIQQEFGGSNPISLSEYYLGGGLVRTNTNAPNGPISSSGLISVGMFRGATQGVQHPPFGTYLGQFCSGFALFFILADGNGGSFNQLQDSYSTSCGYSTPNASWSVSFTNSGTTGPIATNITVNLDKPANTTASFSFTGTILANGANFNTPTITIGTGSSSGSGSANWGLTNNGGGTNQWFPFTLRVQTSSATYPINPGSIDTTYFYSA